MKTTSLIIIGLAVVLAVAGARALQNQWVSTKSLPLAIINGVPADEMVGMTGREMELMLFSQTTESNVPVADGLIADTEYRHRMVDSETSMTLCWQNDAMTLHVDLIRLGWRWVQSPYK